MKKYIIFSLIALLCGVTVVSGSIVPSATLKTYFTTGSKPTQANFIDLIDSSNFSDNWSGKKTTDLPEGTNLYYTDARAIAAIGSYLTNYLSLIDWYSTTTDALDEGSTNLYFTQARARDSISSTATGLTYSSSTGVISLTSGYSIPSATNTTFTNLTISNVATTSNLVFTNLATPNNYLSWNNSSRYLDVSGEAYIGNGLTVGSSGDFYAQHNGYFRNAIAIGSDYDPSIASPHAPPTNGAIIEGNVGIGTTTPASKLQVADGDIFVSSSTRAIIMRSINDESICIKLQFASDTTPVIGTTTCPN